MTVLVIKSSCVVAGRPVPEGAWLDPDKLPRGTADVLIGSGLAVLSERYPVAVPAEPDPEPEPVPAPKKKKARK